MMNIYDYQKIRDILMVLVGGILDGKPGYGILVPRNVDAFKDLQRFLSTKNVKFDTIPGIDSDCILFQYGQNTEIDDTVQQMQYDSGIQEVNQILQQMRNPAQHEKDKKAVQEAVDELKTLVTKVNKFQYEGEKEPSHYSFYFTNVERALSLMVEIGMWVEKHTDQVDGKPVEVLRLPINRVSDWGKKIIEKLKDAAEEKAQRMQQSESRQEPGADKTGKKRSLEEVINAGTRIALEQLKGMIQDISRLPREQELANSGKLFYCFYFDRAKLDQAQDLLLQMRIPTEMKEDDKGQLYLLYSVKEGEMPKDVVDVIHVLNSVITNKSLHHKYEVQRAEAISELENIVTSVMQAHHKVKPDTYYYFYFPKDRIQEAQGLMTVYVGEVPEMYDITQNGQPTGTVVLRYRIDEASAPIDVIETLKNKLKAAVDRRSKVQDRGMGM